MKYMRLTKNRLIKEVVKIILKHTKPERIYLYGSQVSGEADESSDIDIAYEDKNFNEHYLIENEIENLDTLLKIDIKNIAFTDDRFKNRVKSTGRVLYSGSKKLRAQDGLFNFKKALDKYAEVVDKEKMYKEEGFEDIYLDLVVKRFEFTFEMAWKALKRYLSYLGIEAKNPRSVFKEAFAQKIISDENIWLDMIEQRNLSSHIYDEFEIQEILNKKQSYKNAFLLLKENIGKDIIV